MKKLEEISGIGTVIVYFSVAEPKPQRADAGAGAGAPLRCMYNCMYIVHTYTFLNFTLYKPLVRALS
jgi:hypothetical protein